MVKVNSPLFSSFASGSLGKTLTYYPDYNNNKNHVQMKKSRAGKRHPIQIENAQIFKERMQAWGKMKKFYE